GSVWYEDRKLRMNDPPPAAGPHLMVVRPEKLRLIADTDQSGLNMLPATVGDVIYQGDSFICYATLRDGRQVTLRDYCRSDVLAKLPAPGEPITLGIDAQDVVLVADQ
ncbi:MAG: TOBE domain-containing protein, partial [Mesorhizobium sp.]